MTKICEEVYKKRRNNNKYVSHVKINNTEWRKYRFDNINKLAKYLEEQFKDLRFVNIFNNKTKSYMYSFKIKNGEIIYITPFNIPKYN